MLVYLPVVRERGQNILDKATFVEADLKKWEKHLETLEEHCKPRGSRLVAATQYKVLTQGEMEPPEYIEKCRQITDACGWPEDAKDMALRNAVLLGLKHPMVYHNQEDQENQDTLTADRVIEIATTTTRRTTTQQVGHIDFPVVTPPALTRVPQVHTSVNALRPSLDEVNTPTCKIMNDAVILNGKRHCLPITQEYVLSEFKDVFEGIGKLPGGKYHIELKPDVQPIQHPPRAVPEKRKEAYKDELERLCSLGIIEPVAGHTDWINSIVPVAKPDGSIRLCLDPKDLNRSIKRNQYYSKTIDEVSAELHDSRYFTVVDAKSGYWLVELDSESSLLTTFNTPWGKYKWL